MMAFWSGKQQALNVDDLRNLQINGTWSDTIPVKPRGGDVFCYTTTDANKKGQSCYYCVIESLLVLDVAKQHCLLC